MPQSASDVLSLFAAPRDEGQLRQLDGLVSSLSPNSCGPAEIRALLGVFERFPEEDGFGVFWSMLHLLEACSGYEPALIESVTRMPGHFNVLMVNRLLNAGVSQVQGISLVSVLSAVASSNNATGSVRKDAQRFIEHQEAHGRA